jgi:hypothetical protein
VVAAFVQWQAIEQQTFQTLSRAVTTVAATNETTT